MGVSESLAQITENVVISYKPARFVMVVQPSHKNYGDSWMAQDVAGKSKRVGSEALLKYPRIPVDCLNRPYHSNK
jgi:hypothetical protein